MKNTIQKIQAVYTLSKQSLDALTGVLQQVTMPKGKLLFKEGRIENDIYFIEEGIARAYSVHEDKDVTFWFGAEGDLLFSYNSYVANKPGYENIELLEDAVLYKFSIDDIQHLYTTNIELANWGRKFAEQELIKTEERLISRLFQSANQRYHALLETSPHFIQRIQLSHIASYLGVTQVTLSRIRAGKQ